MLSAEQRAAYGTDGFLVLRGFFEGAEIVEIRQEADLLLRPSALLHADNLRCRWQNHLESGEPLLDALDPVTDLAPLVDRLARGPRLQELLHDLLGEPACLFKDKLIYKPPGVLGYALHQDYISWPGFPRSFTTALVAIDRADGENGCLEVFSGGHRRGYLSPADGDYHDLPENLFDPGAKVELPLMPGDVAIFGCFLPHRSAPNRTARPRRHLYLSYNAQSDGGEQREKHYDAFHSWLKQRYREYGCQQFYFR